MCVQFIKATRFFSHLFSISNEAIIIIAFSCMLLCMERAVDIKYDYVGLFRVSEKEQKKKGNITKNTEKDKYISCQFPRMREGRENGKG